MWKSDLILFFLSVSAAMALRLGQTPADPLSTSFEDKVGRGFSDDEDHTEIMSGMTARHFDILSVEFGKLFQERSQCNGEWAHGPVIIGGLSDSGTRGAKYVLKDVLHITMQTKQVLDPGDDNLMNDAIERFWKTFIENVDSISQDSFENAPNFEQMANALCEAVKESWELAGKPMGLWGFKSPRSVLMTPVWNFLFNDNYRFVHVVRDPRANCAYNANKCQYASVCSSLLSEEECTYPVGCFHYWAKVNGDVQQMFSNSGFQSRYVYMSMDRLAIPEPTTHSASYEMASRELAKLSSLDGGKTFMANDSLVMELLRAEHRYASSFASGSFSDGEKLKDLLMETATTYEHVNQALVRLGYNAKDWGITSEYDHVF